MSVKYLIGHWTAGNYKPCSTDLNSYQLLIDGEGKKYIGKTVGKASSTGGMNSITYNISCCGGLPNTPIKPIQIEAFFKACAEKLKEYSLTVDNFYTHAEIGEMCRDGSIKKLLPYNQWLSQNVGKIDLTKIPQIQGTPKQTGDFIRRKVLWYYQKL